MNYHIKGCIYFETTCIYVIFYTTHRHTRIYIYIYIYIYIKWFQFFVVAPKREKVNISKWIGPLREVDFFKEIFILFSYDSNWSVSPRSPKLHGDILASGTLIGKRVLTPLQRCSDWAVYRMWHVGLKKLNHLPQPVLPNLILFYHSLVTFDY